MGLRCLLGHDFAEPTTEREREERGDEVILTIRRVKECRRCGETRVVSENKEVTSMEQPLGQPEAGAGTDSRGERGGRAHEANEASGTGSGTTGRTGRSGAGTGTGADEERSLISDAEAGFDHPNADPDEVDTDVEDDAEIIRSGPSDGDATGAAGTDDPGVRTHGEWPDADANRSTGTGSGGSDGSGAGTGAAANERGDPGSRGTGATGATRAESEDDAAGTGASGGSTDPADEDAEFIDADEATDDPTPWPDHDGDDEGYDATFGDEPTDAADVRGDASTRDADDDADADPGGTEYIEAESDPVDDPASTGGTSGWGAVNPTDPSNGTDRSEPTEPDAERRSDDAAAAGVGLETVSGDPDVEYVCSECGAREPAGASSMRAGDICPDCKRGYIEERELE